MIQVFRAFSRLPLFKGKNLIGQKLFKIFRFPARAIQTMSAGFKMDLSLADRIQRWMFITRCHEIETELAVSKLLKKSKVMFDVGANVGYMSLFAKQISPNLKIYAFEPLPANAQSMRRNITLNGFKNIEVHELCVSDSIGTTEFMIPPGDESGWGRIAYRELFPGGEKVQRDVVTLDEFSKTLHTPVDFIKIDVEGFEKKVLTGAKNLLTAQKPVVCFEVNEPCLVDLGTSGKEIFEFFKGLGYSIYAVHKAPELTKVDEPLSDYIYANYIAMPS